MSYRISLFNYLILLFKGKYNGSGQWVTRWHEFCTQLSPQNQFLTLNVPMEQKSLLTRSK